MCTHYHCIWSQIRSPHSLSCQGNYMCFFTCNFILFNSCLWTVLRFRTFFSSFALSLLGHPNTLGCIKIIIKKIHNCFFPLFLMEKKLTIPIHRLKVWFLKILWISKGESHFRILLCFPWSWVSMFGFVYWEELQEMWPAMTSGEESVINRNAWFCI